MPKETVVEIQGRHLKLSNLDKVLYPDVGFTKGQVIDYYVRIAPVLLPHLEGRPLTMKRYPNGVGGMFFYEKNCPTHRPDWVKTVKVWSEGNNRWMDYCLIEDLPTLVWAANLADLELHTSLSLGKKILQPIVHRLRSRSGGARQHRAVLPGGCVAAQHLLGAGAGELRENFRFEGAADLCAPQYHRQLRRDQAVRARAGAFARAAASGAGCFRHEESAPHGEDSSRLEPERRPQDDGVRVLATGQGAARRYPRQSSGRRSRTV